MHMTSWSFNTDGERVLFWLEAMLRYRCDVTPSWLPTVLFEAIICLLVRPVRTYGQSCSRSYWSAWYPEAIFATQSKRRQCVQKWVRVGGSLISQCAATAVVSLCHPARRPLTAPVVKVAADEEMASSLLSPHSCTDLILRCSNYCFFWICRDVVLMVGCFSLSLSLPLLPLLLSFRRCQTQRHWGQQLNKPQHPRFNTG